MAKILGISGSPRRHGNTETLLDSALEGAAKAGATVEKIVVSELCIAPCRGCFRCAKNGVCVVKDDMRVVFRKFDGADGVIVASPIYFGSLSAQFKTMIDRFNSYWVRRYVLKKPIPGKRKGVFLSCAGENKPKYFTNAKSIVRFLFATLNIRYVGGLFCGGVSETGEIMKKNAVLRKSFRVGEKLAKSL